MVLLLLALAALPVHAPLIRCLRPSGFLVVVGNLVGVELLAAIAHGLRVRLVGPRRAEVAIQRVGAIVELLLSEFCRCLHDGLFGGVEREAMIDLHKDRGYLKGGDENIWAPSASGRIRDGVPC